MYRERKKREIERMGERLRYSQRDSGSKRERVRKERERERERERNREKEREKEGEELRSLTPESKPPK